jgi:hypothetical protein
LFWAIVDAVIVSVPLFAIAPPLPPAPAGPPLPPGCPAAPEPPFLPFRHVHC